MFFFFKKEDLTILMDSMSQLHNVAAKKATVIRD